MWFIVSRNLHLLTSCPQNKSTCYSFKSQGYHQDKLINIHNLRRWWVIIPNIPFTHIQSIQAELVPASTYVIPTWRLSAQPENSCQVRTWVNASVLSTNLNELQWNVIIHAQWYFLISKCPAYKVYCSKVSRNPRTLYCFFGQTSTTFNMGDLTYMVVLTVAMIIIFHRILVNHKLQTREQTICHLGHVSSFNNMNKHWK